MKGGIYLSEWKCITALPKTSIKHQYLNLKINEKDKLERNKQIFIGCFFL